LLKFQSANELGKASKRLPVHGTVFAFSSLVAVRATLRCLGLRGLQSGRKPELCDSSCNFVRVKEHPMMRNRRNTLLWMKDLIEHMSRCHDQLEWANDGETQSFLADSLLGDLSECQKLCEQLRTGQTQDRRTHSLVAT
jgi:hypothetical protein